MLVMTNYSIIYGIEKCVEDCPDDMRTHEKTIQLGLTHGFAVPGGLEGVGPVSLNQNEPPGAALAVLPSTWSDGDYNYLLRG